MVKVKLKNGLVKEYQSGITLVEIAKSLGGSLYKTACVAKVDDKLVDLSFKIEQDCTIEILTFNDELGKKVYWHTTSHILAQAVKRLFKGAVLAIGPAIDKGFYYDFALEKSLTPEDLIKIEEEMKKIIKEDLPIEAFELSYGQAISLMEEKGQPYKIELIKGIAEKDVPLLFRRQGEFIDLCSGPHLLSTGKVKSIKLLNCTGAYWKGVAKGPMLQRVYGISFPKASDLEDYLKAIEEAKKRDHRKIGKEMELFEIMEEGPGFPFFLPNGMILRDELEKFWKEEHDKAGYVEIKTPIILNKDLWLRSGHWDHYKDNMYTTQIDDEDFSIKPMNCPGGMLVYKSKMHSYKELPIRMAERGLVHRHELSGALHGLMRVRCFTQDDSHIFMMPEQIESEIKGVMDLIDKFYSIFGFNYSIELSTRPENSMGSDEQWNLATDALKKVLDKCGKEYKINEGDGAFYGPKIDFHLEDCLGRTWQCGTIQLDFQMPERFDLSYIGEDGEKHRPVMVHRVVLGSIERFIAILTEHFAGAFPIWLMPEQVRVLPISERFHNDAKKIEDALKSAKIRVSVDNRSEKIGYKIREAQLKKIPYMIIVGEKEVQSGNISVRSRKTGDMGSMKLDDFINSVKNEIDTKII